ncbi:ATP-binding protein [Noviherbaspirillum sp. Root189]|uniref:ATP-binding protein n=1 Tax=Noviherbaspirillum sp. Root189 TaxID=1736487 RepID=UPI00070EF3E8|nr:ATP-binding protein [Noviherbaspirillum sp. Root189]KRB89947.1 hypothetical protein ASE07_17590 [Noviherbaspirillum sp. Root189]
MIFRRPAAGSLARRFALASAALATFALILTTASSWWLVTQQHGAAMHILSQKEVDFHAATMSSTLHAISSRLSEVANSSILATGLVDSAGRETYITPYLNSIRQINGVPIQVLFTDFSGKEISGNSIAQFTDRDMQWLVRHIDSGRRGADIIEGPNGPELIGVELLVYARTQTPEGALLYKILLRDLQPNDMARLAWGTAAPATTRTSIPAVKVAVNSPPVFKHLNFHIVEPPRETSAADLAPQFATIFIIALALAGTVLVLGSRLAVKLTKDLQKLEAFSRSVVSEGFSRQRAEPGRSTEIASLAGSINHMLDRLYEQHAELQREREKFLQLANTIPQLAWIANSDGRIHWYNDRWYEYTGTKPEQMEGLGWQSVHDPAMLPHVIERMQASIDTGQPFQMTFPLRGADGEFRPFFTSAAPLRDGAGRIVQWFGTNTDVSQIERAERAVRESEERLREGLVAARMAVWDWDLGSGQLRFSANAADIFGIATMADNAAWDAVHREDLPALRKAINQAVRERSYFDQVVRMIRSDTGALIWVEASGKIISDDQGNPQSMRGIMLDVTVRKQAEEALRIANRRKDEFLAMLAHELRNPLAPISTAAEILKMAHPDPERVRLTSEIITRQVDHMTSLIHDLLDVSRVTRGLVTLEREPVSTAEVISGAVEQVRPLIQSRKHMLKIGPLSEVAYVTGDRTRLVQIVSNLLNNAAKYTAEGGDIIIAVGLNADTVDISVRDTGIGISSDLLPHVFELFTQAERSPDRSQGGLGLGLALVRSLVELHGGSVDAYSEGTDRGSLFTVRLPRLAMQDLVGALKPEAAVHAKRPTVACELMIVDDNIDAARSLAVLMEAEGHRVTVEHRADKALETARRQPPQVFLLDIGLPEMDGYTLAAKLREMPETRDALLIAVTGYGRKEDREKSETAGFDYHIVKPATREEVAAILAQGRREQKYAS